MMYCAEKCADHVAEKGDLPLPNSNINTTTSEGNINDCQSKMDIEQSSDDTGQVIAVRAEVVREISETELCYVRLDSIDSELAGLEVELGMLATLADAEHHRRLIGDDPDIGNVELPTVGDSTDEEDDVSSCSDSADSGMAHEKDWTQLEDNNENLDPSKIAALSSAFSNYISTPKHKGKKEISEPAMGQFLLPLVTAENLSDQISVSQVSTDHSVMEVLAAEAKKYKKAGDEVKALADRILQECRALELQQKSDEETPSKPKQESQPVDMRTVVDFLSKCVDEDKNASLFDELKRELNIQESSVEESTEGKEYPDSILNLEEFIDDAQSLIDTFVKKRSKMNVASSEQDDDFMDKDADNDMSDQASFADTLLAKSVMRCVSDGRKEILDSDNAAVAVSELNADSDIADLGCADPNSPDAESDDRERETSDGDGVNEQTKNVTLDVITRFKFLECSPLRSTLEHYMMMQIAGREADAEQQQQLLAHGGGSVGGGANEPPQRIFDCDSVNTAERFISQSSGDGRSLCPGGCGNSTHCSRYRKNQGAKVKGGEWASSSGEGDAEATEMENHEEGGADGKDGEKGQQEDGSGQEGGDTAWNSCSLLSERARFVDLQWAWWEVRALLCAVWHAAGVASSPAAAAEVAVGTVPPCHCCRCSHRLAQQLPPEADAPSDRCQCQKLRQRPRPAGAKGPATRERCKACIAHNDGRLKLISLLWGRGEPPAACCCKERRSAHHEPGGTCKVRIFFKDPSLLPVQFDLAQDEEEVETVPQEQKEENEHEEFFRSSYTRFLYGDEDIPRGDEGVTPVCQRCRCRCGKPRFYCPKQRDISITENIDNFTRLAPQLLILRLDTLCAALCARHGAHLARILAGGAVMTFLKELWRRAAAMRGGGVALSGILGPTRRRLATVCGRLLAPHRYLTGVYCSWADRAAATRVVHLSMLLLLGEEPPQSIEALRSFSSLLSMMNEAETLHADVTMFLGNYRQCERDEYLETIRTKFLTAQQESLDRAKTAGLLGDDPCQLPDSPDAECSVVARRLSECLPKDPHELEEFKRIVQAMLLCHTSGGGLGQLSARATRLLSNTPSLVSHYRQQNPNTQQNKVDDERNTQQNKPNDECITQQNKLVTTHNGQAQLNQDEYSSNTPENNEELNTQRDKMEIQNGQLSHRDNFECLNTLDGSVGAESQQCLPDVFSLQPGHGVGRMSQTGATEVSLQSNCTNDQQSMVVSEVLSQREKEVRCGMQARGSQELEYWRSKRRLLEGLLREQDQALRMDALQRILSTQPAQLRNGRPVREEIGSKKTEAIRSRPVKRKLKTSEYDGAPKSEPTERNEPSKPTQPNVCLKSPVKVYSRPYNRTSCPNIRKRRASIGNTSDIYRKDKMEYSLANCFSLTKSAPYWSCKKRPDSTKMLKAKTKTVSFVTKAKFDSRVVLVNLLPVTSNGFSRILRWYSCPDVARNIDEEFDGITSAAEAFANMKFYDEDSANADNSMNSSETEPKNSLEPDSMNSQRCIQEARSNLIGLTSKLIPELFIPPSSSMDPFIDIQLRRQQEALDASSKEPGRRKRECSMQNVLNNDKMLTFESLTKSNLGNETKDQRYLRMQMCECLAKMDNLGLEDEHNEYRDAPVCSEELGDVSSPPLHELSPTEQTPAYSAALNQNRRLLALNQTLRRSQGTDISNLLNTANDIMAQEKNLLKELIDYELSGSKKDEMELLDDVNVREPAPLPFLEPNDLNQLEGTDDKESWEDTPLSTPKRRKVYKDPIIEKMPENWLEDKCGLKMPPEEASEFEHVMKHISESDSIADLLNRLSIHKYPSLNLWNIAEDPSLLTPETIRQLKEVRQARSGKKQVCGKRKNGNNVKRSTNFDGVIASKCLLESNSEQSLVFEDPTKEEIMVEMLSHRDEQNGFTEKEFLAKLFTASLQVVMRKVLQVMMPCEEDLELNALIKAGKFGSDYDVKVGNVVDGCNIDDYWEEIKSHFTSWRAFTLEQYWSLPEEYRRPSKRTAKTDEAVREMQQEAEKMAGECKGDKGSCYVCKDCESIKLKETDLPDDQKKRAVKKTVANKVSLETKIKNVITPVEHAMFVEKLQAVNKDYVDKLLKQNFTGEDWILTMNELQKLEKKLKSAVGKNSSSGTSVKNVEETREAELLAGRGLSKLINQFSSKKASETVKQDLNAKVTKTAEESQCSCADPSKCHCGKDSTKNGPTLGGATKPGDAKKDDKQADPKKSSDASQKTGQKQDETKTAEDGDTKSKATIKKVVVINNIQGKVKTITVKTEEKTAGSGDNVSNASRPEDAPPPRSGEVQIVNGVAMKDGVPMDGVTIRDIIEAQFPAYRDSTLKMSDPAPKMSATVATKGKPGQSPAIGAAGAARPGCEGGKGDSHQHVCTVNHGNSEGCSNPESGRCSQHPASPRPGSGDQPCNCCYCTVFGHAPPATTPVSKNFNETRERLRSILNRKKQRCRPGGSLSSQGGGDSDTADGKETSTTTIIPALVPTVKPDPIPANLPPKKMQPHNPILPPDADRPVAQLKATPIKVSKPAEIIQRPIAIPKPIAVQKPVPVQKVVPVLKPKPKPEHQSALTKVIGNSALEGKDTTFKSAIDAINMSIKSKESKVKESAVEGHQDIQKVIANPAAVGIAKEQKEEKAELGVEEQNSKNAKKYKLVACNESKGIQTDKPKCQPQPTATQAPPQAQPQPPLQQQQQQAPPRPAQAKKPAQPEPATRPKAGTARAPPGNADWQTMTASTTTTTSRDSSVFSTSSVCSGCSEYRVRVEDTRDLDMLIEFIEGPGRGVDKVKKKAKKARQKAKKLVERLKQELSALSAEAEQLRAEAVHQERLVAAAGGKRKKTTKKGKGKKGEGSGEAEDEKAIALRKVAKEVRERASRAEGALEAARRRLAKVNAAISGLNISDKITLDPPEQQQQVKQPERQKQPSPEESVQASPNLEQLLASSLHPQAACNGKQEQCMVTIKRVMMPDRGEPSVTITPKGSDKPIYTFQVGGSGQPTDERRESVSPSRQISANQQQQMFSQQQLTVAQQQQAAHQQQMMANQLQQQQTGGVKKKSSTPSWEATIAQINALSQNKKKPKEKSDKPEAKPESQTKQTKKQNQQLEKSAAPNSSTSSVNPSRSTSTVSELSSVDMTPVPSKRQRKLLEKRLKELQEEDERCQREMEEKNKKKNTKGQQKNDKKQQNKETEEEPGKIVLSMHQLKTAVKRALEAMDEDPTDVKLLDSKGKGKLKDSAKEFIEKVVSKVEETKKGTMKKEKVVDISEVVLGSFSNKSKNKNSGQVQQQQPKQTHQKQQAESKKDTQKGGSVGNSNVTNAGGKATVAAKNVDTAPSNGLRVVGGKGTLKCGKTAAQPTATVQQNTNNNNNKKRQPPQVQAPVTSVHQRTTAVNNHQTKQPTAAAVVSGNKQQQAYYYQQQQQSQQQSYSDKIHLNSDITIQLATGKEGHQNMAQSPSQLIPDHVKANGPVSCSIMEQLRNGVQVADLKLPPGITLTWVDPAKKQPDPTPKAAIPSVNLSNVAPEYRPTPPVVAPPALIMVDTKNIQPVRDNKSQPAAQPQAADSSKSKSKKSKKKSKKTQNLMQQAETSTHSHMRVEEPKMVTLRNPMFHPTLPAVSVSSLQSGKRVGESIRIPDPIPMPPNACQATITPTSNGMFTIRNPLMSMVHQQNMMALGQAKENSPVILMSNQNRTDVKNGEQSNETRNVESIANDLAGRMAEMGIATSKHCKDEIKSAEYLSHTAAASQVLNLNFTPNKDRGYSLFKSDANSENETSASPVIERIQLAVGNPLPSATSAPSPIGSGNKALRNMTQYKDQTARQLDFNSDSRKAPGGGGWQIRPEPVGTPRKNDDQVLPQQLQQSNSNDTSEVNAGGQFYTPFGQADSDKLFGSLLFQNSTSRDEQSHSVWSPVTSSEEPARGQPLFPKMDQQSNNQNAVEISLVQTEHKPAQNTPPSVGPNQFRNLSGTYNKNPGWGNFPYQDYQSQNANYLPQQQHNFGQYTSQPSQNFNQVRSSHSSSSSGLMTGSVISSGTNSVYDSVSNSSSNSPADTTAPITQDAENLTQNSPPESTRIDRTYTDFSPYVTMLQQQPMTGNSNCYNPMFGRVSDSPGAPAANERITEMLAANRDRIPDLSNYVHNFGYGVAQNQNYNNHGRMSEFGSADLGFTGQQQQRMSTDFSNDAAFGSNARRLSDFESLRGQTEIFAQNKLDSFGNLVNPDPLGADDGRYGTYGPIGSVTNHSFQPEETSVKGLGAIGSHRMTNGVPKSEEYYGGGYRWTAEAFSHQINQ